VTVTLGKDFPMSRQDRPRALESFRRYSPALEPLEGRLLLATTISSTNSPFFATSAFQLQSDYNSLVTQLRNMELRSRATPAQFRALRDDVRSISEATASAAANPQVLASKALAATLQIDRAPLDGWLDSQGWTDLAGRLAPNLVTLGAPQPLIAQTLADMRAIGTAVGLSHAGFVSYSSHFNHVRAEENSLPSGYGNLPDPGVYYTQHLRGFFRGWASEKAADTAKLSADLKSLGTPGGAVVLKRDTRVLEGISAQVPSAASARMLQAYSAALSQGVPTSVDLDALRLGITDALGPGVSARRASQINLFIRDAPAFGQALGSSPANLQAIAADVQALINDGAGSGPNPFRIQVHPRP
jgi:hypothetical protein